MRQNKNIQKDFIISSQNSLFSDVYFDETKTIRLVAAEITNYGTQVREHYQRTNVISLSVVVAYGGAFVESER